MDNKKKSTRLRRHRAIKLKIRGTSQRPRLVVQRSLKNLSACLLEDAGNKTLFSLSTLNKEVREKFLSAGNIKAAEFFGGLFARLATEKGFKKIVFDRAGYLYHGRIKAFAEALRKGGLEF